MKKNILILGASGFIGTNIIYKINKDYFDKYNIITFDFVKNIHRSIDFIDNATIKSYIGDFSDKVLIRSIFEENEIDIVIHLISTVVPSTSKNFAYEIESNLISTINLLDVISNSRKVKFIFLSSGGSIYGDSDTITTHSETDLPLPISSYGIIKLSIEKYLFLYSKLGYIDYLVLRLSNPYGKYHYSNKQGIINIALSKSILGDTFYVWGTGSAIKDYIFIDDFTNILFKLEELGVVNEVINIGSGTGYSVKNVLEIIQNIVPSFCWENIESKESDVKNSLLDISLLKSYIGNYEFIPLEEGMKITYNWIKNRIECQDL